MPEAIHPTPTSSALRTIAARLCLHDETALDGQMVRSLADAVATMESELANIRESAGDLCMTLNDQTEALRALAERLNKPNNQGQPPQVG